MRNESLTPDPGLTPNPSPKGEGNFNGEGGASGDGTPSWDSRFPAYVQLSAQITRWFRHFSVYIGGENLTGFRQKQTIINAADPWSSTFDPTMVWGPAQGAMFYAGVRVNFGRL